MNPCQANNACGLRTRLFQISLDSIEDSSWPEHDRYIFDSSRGEMYFYQ